MKTIIHHLTLNNKKYAYQLFRASEETTRVVCEAANIDQEFLNEDVVALLKDLPDLIQAEKKYRENQDVVIRFRVTVNDKQKIEKESVKKGYNSVSNYLRDLALGKK